MSQISALIKEFCPRGVTYRALGEVASFQRGTPITKRNVLVGSVPVIAGGRTPAYFHGESNRSGETIAVAGSGAYAGFISYWTEPVFVSDAFTIHVSVERLAPKYVYYCLRAKQDVIHASKRGGGVPHVNGVDVARLLIPVPPLEVQREIVRILDRFTALEAELEAELEARRTQYEYYRNTLLRLPEGEVRRAAIGDICVRVSSGATPLVGRSDYYEGGDIPWLRTQEVAWRDIYGTELKITERALRETAAKWIPANCVIVAISGATAARAAVNKIPLTTNQHCCNLQIDPSQADYRYVFHWVTAHYAELKAHGRGARSDLNGELIKSFPISVPPLREQQRIAGLLDTFDALVNDLSIGLPAELKARRKQYEYYRDRLLTFEELAP